MKDDRIIVSIDIGTTKICVLIAQYHSRDQVEILGIGKTPSDGLRKGVVVDIAKTVRSIKDAVKEAELMAGVSVDAAYVGISGAHIQARSSQGMVPIRRGEITDRDVAQVLASARTISISDDQQILHVLPQYYTINSTERVLDPIGMHGIRLEAQVHIISGSIASVQNIVKCCQMAGVKVADIILEQLASAQAVLTHDELQLGVAMLDIGGGTSDLAVYHNGAIRHTMVLPLAGNHFTNDLAVGLLSTIKDAERIKKEFGCAYLPVLLDDQPLEIIKVDGSEKHLILQSELVSILEPRAQEILQLVYQELDRHELQPFIPAGLVLTGGGSLLNGMKDLAQAVFHLPVRIGNPQLEDSFGKSIESPIYATAYGLLLYALRQQEGTFENLAGPIIKRIASRMKSWVADFF